MSLHLPVRQAVNVARASIARPSQYLLPQTQRRNAGWFSRFRKPRADNSSPENSQFAKELTKRQKETRLAERLSEHTQGASIFDEDIKHAEEEQTKEIEEHKAQTTALSFSRMKEHMERALDPDPRWRVRYQRKKIMQMVRADGKMTKAERIMMMEKEVTNKSDLIPTSTKKLVHLSHQIAGKTVDEAITQMRFSKKKMAREVKYYLELARDTAIAGHGMGLGVHNGELLKKERKIVTRDGKKVSVADPTRLYVDQSWVTKGPPRGMRILFHSRGRASQAFRPTSRINLVIKEEKTRIRQYDERVEREAKKAPWVQLPNRPVTAQRPYYSW
ncbi:ribosomal protein L22/L17 [Xylaria nigripes]|nr:ribosomal protein L22/L17 [Xylaria nigripes]